MIVRYEPDRTLADCEALSIELRVGGHNRSPATIRKHCTPVAIDPESGRQLYDVDKAREALTNVRARAPHRRTRRS